jgi:dolichol-phosphate mannosyltransferase
VVIPTYEEALCIGPLLDRICGEVIPALGGWDVQVLVVDGNSPDGTSSVVGSRLGRYSCLHLLLEEKKTGIGAAYRKGFACAISELHADVVIEFDGDCQHPPEMIPVLLGRIESGADCVLGSRRIPGGSYPAGWGLWRLCLSRYGGLFARCLLLPPLRAFRKVTDITTGLKATRVRGCLDRIGMETLAEQGFGYKIEMLHRILSSGAIVEEVPLEFRLRAAGRSKSDRGTSAEILGCIARLRRKGI